MRVIGVVLLLGYVASCATSEDATGSGPPSGTGGAAQDSAPSDAADSSTEDAVSDVATDTSATDASDASDANTEDAAEDAPVDAPPDSPLDVGSDAPLGCQWVPVAACDTGGTIQQFCSGTVKTLRRCDQTLFIPDAVYLQFHLCSCSFQACGCNGVVWDAVECCN